MLPTATNPEPEIACHHAAKNRNAQNFQSEKFNRSIFSMLKRGSSQATEVFFRGKRPQKSERPARVPGHALGVLYSGLHGTVWPTRKVRTTGVYLPLEPVQIGRRHTRANRPPWQRAARDKSGHFRNSPLKHARNQPAKRRSTAFRKMIQSPTEALT
jgi:hypothetical protein